ncbi:hypothetical protein DM01DRAFT_1340440 [Hesseltinella vesiculosa]|uniref:Uncharacterized protein n=1 Tax=Hesseltinella vesiculosa TaxID=101127 RepID=A0A1X2G3Z9_9FUNG|nr:hypothetical protein DM01DRAFT_1340440 [Hesseltinella vesiculosa]
MVSTVLFCMRHRLIFSNANVLRFIVALSLPLLQQLCVAILVTWMQVRAQYQACLGFLQAMWWKVYMKVMISLLTQRNLYLYCQTIASIYAALRGRKHAVLITCGLALALLGVLASVGAYYCYNRERTTAKLTATVESKYRHILGAVNMMAIFIIHIRRQTP